MCPILIPCLFIQVLYVLHPLSVPWTRWLFPNANPVYLRYRNLNSISLVFCESPRIHYFYMCLSLATCCAFVVEPTFIDMFVSGLYVAAS